MHPTTQFKFRAFLSYAHADRTWGKWLHGRLEGARIDEDLVGRETPMGTVPQSLRPIFRDREDFTGGHILADATIAALDASAALIVLCSTVAAGRPAVNEEVRLFRWRHPDRPVIPVIIDGTPPSNFPPALRCKVAADGSVTEDPVTILAPDLRETGDGQYLGLAKVIAGLTGLTTDEIARRAERHRRRRFRSIVAALSSIIITLTGLAIWAEINRRDAIAQRGAAIEQRRIAVQNAMEAQKQKAQSDILRNFYQMQALAADENIEKAQLIAVELFEHVELLKQRIGEAGLFQFYYDLFSGPFHFVDNAVTTTHESPNAPLAQLVAHFVKIRLGCESAECEQLILTDKTLGISAKYGCEQLGLCYESAFSEEGNKRVIPHPFLPIALVEIYAYGDWRLFNLSTGTISKNIFPNPLTCFDECYNEKFEACFLGRDEILWRDRRRFRDSVMVTDYEGHIGGIFGDGNVSYKPSICLPDGVVSMPQETSTRNPAEIFHIRQGMPFLRRFVNLGKDEIELLKKNGIAAIAARPIVHKLLRLETELVGHSPDYPEAAQFGFLATFKDNRTFGIDHSGCLKTVSRDQQSWKLHYCLRSIGRIGQRPNEPLLTGLSADGQWLVRVVDRGVEAWRVLDDLSGIIVEGSRLLTRCLTADERKSIFLNLEPPRWCITGAVSAVGEAMNSELWRAKWPYRTPEWKEWLLRKDKGENPQLPQEEPLTEPSEPEGEAAK